MEENKQIIEDTYRTFVESSTLPIIIFQGEPPTVVYANDAITTMLGYTPEEITTMSYEMIVHPDDRLRIKERIEGNIKGDLILQRSQARLIKKDNTVVCVIGNPSRIYHQGQPAHMVIIIDITEKILAETKLMASNRELELYTSLLRHDFRNDIMVLNSVIELIKIESQDPQEKEQHLSIASRALSRMASLISLVEPDAETPPYTLFELVEQRADHARIIHPKLKITLDISEDAKNEGQCHNRLLSSIFDNLFRNAASYAGPKPEVHVKIEIEKDYPRICIVDDGTGISSEIRDKLFTAKTSTSGGGIGLSLCRRIITGFGGTLELLDTSPLGSGAAFQILLPRISETKTESGKF